VDVTLSLEVNGKSRSVTTDPERPLLEVLREDIQLTGTKYGCGEGQCRACTVLLDGRPVTSCLTPVSKAAGKKITTIEGLEQNGRLQVVQQAFLEEGAMQCGDCVPAIRDRLREKQELKVQSKPATKERFVGDNTKVKIAIMLDDGDKLEYEAHVQGRDLEAAKSEAERRLQSTVAALSGKGAALKADRVKIETH